MRNHLASAIMKLNARRAALESLGILGLTCATVFFAVTSWRKSSDPLIDFGEQLYSAWQLSQGAVLYRDVDLLYGPLSQYFNAAIFRIFGPGLSVLAIVNLVVFAAICTSIYVLFRRSWGVLAAWSSTLIFISVFGFSYFVDLGNYNYVTPYAHETTHGMLVCLLLCFVLAALVKKTTLARAFFAGLLFGMTLVLKPEFILAAIALTVLAGSAHWKRGDSSKLGIFFSWALGALLPTVSFTFYFAWFMPWSRAAAAASRAWINTLDTSLTADPLQMRLLGLGRPWSGLVNQALATAISLGLILALGIAVMLAERKMPRWLLLFSGTALAAVLGWLAWSVISWIEIGSCLFGLTLIYLLASLGSFVHKTRQSDSDFDRRVLRLLIACLAVALMARMILNPHIYHYGYYQAALAALVVPAIMIGELPVWFRAGSPGQMVVAMGTLIIVLPGITNLAMRSQHRYLSRTFAVASGRDRFYCLPPQIDPLGKIINSIADVLREKGQGKTLTVLPEGEFINYLARLRNPLPHAFFYAGATSGGRETQVVNDMSRSPPYWIVIISRDLVGYGIERYGEKPGSGAEILEWVERNYEQVASVGGDPLDYRERGATILRKYSP
jgi:hypothetical protein